MSLYFRLLEDLEKWLKEVETALASDDVGKDLGSVQVCVCVGTRAGSQLRREAGRGAGGPKAGSLDKVSVNAPMCPC